MTNMYHKVLDSYQGVNNTLEHWLQNKIREIGNYTIHSMMEDNMLAIMKKDKSGVIYFKIDLRLSRVLFDSVLGNISTKEKTDILRAIEEKLFEKTEEN